MLITFAALLYPPGVLVSNGYSSSGFGTGPQDHPHAPFFVVYDLKGVAFGDVDCPPDKRQIHNDFVGISERRKMLVENIF